MRAIKIDPANRTIEEIELAVDPNRSMGELRSLIGTNCLQLIPLDRGINLIAAAVNEQDAGFGFVGGDLVIRGVAVVLGGRWKRLRALDEGLRSFELTVEWHDEQKGAQNAET